MRLAPLLLLTAACGHWFPISKDQLEALSALRERGRVPISDGQRHFDLTAEDEPRVRLHFDGCAARSAEGCETDGDGKVQDLRIEDETLSFLQHRGRHYIGYAARLEDVRSAELTFKDYREPDWRPTYGVGAAAGGPGLALTGIFQVLPYDWLALELGLGSPAWAVFTADAATRLRLNNLRGVHPFIGAWIHWIEAPEAAAWGGRVGIDYELSGGRWLLTTEVDFGHPLENAGAYPTLPRTSWFPWAGVALSYFL